MCESVIFTHLGIEGNHFQPKFILLETLLSKFPRND